MKKRLLQEALRLKLDSYMNESEARQFTELVNEQSQIYKLDIDWLTEMKSDYEFHYKTKWNCSVSTIKTN